MDRRKGIYIIYKGRSSFCSKERREARRLEKLAHPFENPAANCSYSAFNAIAGSNPTRESSVFYSGVQPQIHPSEIDMCLWTAALARSIGHFPGKILIAALFFQSSFLWEAGPKKYRVKARSVSIYVKSFFTACLQVQLPRMYLLLAQLPDCHSAGVRRAAESVCFKQGLPHNKKLMRLEEFMKRW